MALPTLCGFDLDLLSVESKSSYSCHYGIISMVIWSLYCRVFDHNLWSYDSSKIGFLSGRDNNYICCSHLVLRAFCGRAIFTCNCMDDSSNNVSKISAKIIHHWNNGGSSYIDMLFWMEGHCMRVAAAFYLPVALFIVCLLCTHFQKSYIRVVCKQANLWHGRSGWCQQLSWDRHMSCPVLSNFTGQDIGHVWDMSSKSPKILNFQRKTPSIGIFFPCAWFVQVWTLWKCTKKWEIQDFWTMVDVRGATYKTG